MVAVKDLWLLSGGESVINSSVLLVMVTTPETLSGFSAGTLLSMAICGVASSGFQMTPLMLSRVEG